MGRHGGKPLVRLRPGVYVSAEGYRLEQAVAGSRGVGSAWGVFTPEREYLDSVDSLEEGLQLVRQHRYGPPVNGYYKGNRGP